MNERRIETHRAIHAPSRTLGLAGLGSRGGKPVRSRRDSYAIVSSLIPPNHQAEHDARIEAEAARVAAEMARMEVDTAIARNRSYKIIATWEKGKKKQRVPNHPFFVDENRMKLSIYRDGDRLKIEGTKPNGEKPLALTVPVDQLEVVIQMLRQAQRSANFHFDLEVK